jgi:hypothetical protein
VALSTRLDAGENSWSPIGPAGADVKSVLRQRARRRSGELPGRLGGDAVRRNPQEHERGCDLGFDTGFEPDGAGYVGALFVSSSDGDLSGIVVRARTSSPHGDGRGGLFSPATPFGSTSTDPTWLYGLRQDGTNRTILALVNTGETDGGDDVFAVDVYDGATGRLVQPEEGLTVGARRRRQENNVLSRWAPGVTSGYARIRRTDGSNPFVPQAVINDGGVPQQRSDGGAFLPAAD